MKLDLFRAKQFNTYECLKKVLFAKTVVAVNGESVVVHDHTEVNKFMLRYPGDMPIKMFEASVTSEVSAVTSRIGSIALDTDVSTRQASIFRNPNSSVMSVVQTQRKLDLDLHMDVNLDQLAELPMDSNLDRTASDLELLLERTGDLIAHDGFYTDLAIGSGNLRRNISDGSITLIDVMPFYIDGSRLIGDHPEGIIPRLQYDIACYQEFVGKFGS